MIKTKSDTSVIIYQSKDGGLVVSTRMTKGTIWLNQSQIAELFDTDRTVITKHISNIFKSLELDEKSNVQKMHITGSDKPIKYYDLDVIISVGYRTNSKKATQFRIWATKVLKDHLLKGYTINQKLLLSQRNKFKELQTAINFLEDHAKNNQLRGQGLELLSLVKDYTKSLNLLEQYDNKKFIKKRGTKAIIQLSHDLALKVIESVRENLSQSGKNLGMLGVDTNKKLESIIGNLNQTFSGVDHQSGKSFNNLKTEYAKNY